MIPRFLLAAAAALLLAPNVRAADAPAPLKPIADHLWTYTHAKEHSKSVVAEFGSFLAVIESPGDEAAARAMLDSLAVAFPDKSVRFLLHTHHHGHSLAAIDPWLARDVTLVTAPDNIDVVRGRSANPERFERAVLRATEGLTIGDGLNSMVLHVIEKDDYPVPTDQYTVIEFPRQKMLVSGCLYTKPLTYHGVVNTRKTSLRDFMAEHLSGVEWLVNTSSCEARGDEDVSSLATFRASLEQGLRPEEVAARLQGMSLEEIDAALPTLTAELAARTDRSYDLLVCANHLRREVKDLPRAEKLFGLTAAAFPDDADAAFYLGMARLEMGEDAACQTAWDRCLELCDGSEERADWEETMANTRARVAKMRADG